MTVGQELVFQDVGGTNDYLSASPPYNRGIGKELFPNERYKVVFKAEEPHPLKIRNEHDPADRQLMVLVRNDAFAAVTDNSGSWTIKALPQGLNRFQVFHEVAGPQVAKHVWKKSQFEVKMSGAGSHNMGVIEVPLSAFEKK